MVDIVHDFPINAPASQVFAGISTPTGLDAWWSLTSSGSAETGTVYDLNFGEGYDWKAVVSQCETDRAFELELTEAHQDWQGTRVGFLLEESDGVTQVRFHHLGWPETNAHYRGSCYCWAMYLRLLKRFVELGETVPYGQRLDV